MKNRLDRALAMQISRVIHFYKGCFVLARIAFLGIIIPNHTFALESESKLNSISTANEGKAHIFELLQENRWESPIIHCVLDSEGNDDPKPRILVHKDKIDILSKNGKHWGWKMRKKNQSQSDEISISEVSRYAPIFINGSFWKYDGEGYGNNRICIIDENGKEILCANDAVGAVSIHCSPSGDYFVALNPLMALPPAFYGASGLRNNWQLNFGKWGEQWPNLYITGIDFARSGEYVAIGTGGMGKPFLFLYDSLGNEIWRRKGGRASGFSPCTKYIAHSVDYGLMELLDIEGNKIWDSHLPQRERTLGYFAFTPDGKILRAASYLGDIYGINVKSGRIDWHWDCETLRNTGNIDLELGKLNVRGLEVLPAGETIVCCQSDLNDFLIILSGNGELLDTVRLPSDSFVFYEEYGFKKTVMLAISAHGSKISLPLKSGMRLYKVNLPREP